MNKFGGNWTEKKIEILVEYASAYLTIMNIHAERWGWDLLYFDGFAGSGFIEKGSKENKRLIIGAAQRILELDEPRSFDMYYFVEKNQVNTSQLIKNTKNKFKNKDIRIVNEDCNVKIHSMSKFLKTKKGKKYRVLAYIDPCGMQLNWESLVALQESKVDAWILIPTGLGVNRLLKKNKDEISDAWLNKLELFLGMSKEDILNYFYKEETQMTLFGEVTINSKEEKAIEKSAELYASRLGELFQYVSKPYVLKNSTNSTMFHFLMASNNGGAINAANGIVKKYNARNK